MNVAVGIFFSTITLTRQTTYGLSGCYLVAAAAFVKFYLDGTVQSTVLVSVGMNVFIAIYLLAFPDKEKKQNEKRH